MVKLHNLTRLPQGVEPPMPRHKLTAKKTVKTFSEGEQFTAFIARFTDGRFAVMDASFQYPQKHYAVFSESDLHETFEEAEA